MVFDRIPALFPVSFSNLCLRCYHCGIPSQINIKSYSEFKKHLIPGSNGRAYFYEIHRDTPTYNSLRFEEIPEFYLQKFEDVAHIRQYSIRIVDKYWFDIGDSYRYDNAAKNDNTILRERKIIDEEKYNDE